MSNKRITDLTELTTPTTDDVFPVVDIATNTTTKVQLGNLPVPTSVTTALATKENTITPGTTAQYYRGDKSFQTLDKTAVGLGNVDNTSDANKPVSTATQTVLNAKQDTLVSGTNIKTINSTSLLGSGNITIAANPSGVAGAIQFSDGSAFASDATNFFWNNTTKRLGVGTNSPSATAHFKGSGSTSATTSLLVQNSAGTAALTVLDNLTTSFGGATTTNGDINFTGQLIRTSRGRINFYGTDGEITLTNSTENGFGLLKFGGLTSSFPALKRASNNIEVKNADDTFGAGLSVGAALNASAILQADSTTKGFLPPRMTTTQKNAISTPAAGLVVYDSTTNKLQCYNGSTWNDLF